MTDASGTTGYTYDVRNRVLTKATPAGTLTYTYDLAGNVATVRSSNANGTSVDYAWDAADQLASVTDNRAGGITTAAFTPTGRPAGIANPNGVTAAYSYDNLDRVVALMWNRGTDPAFSGWNHTYNDRGQRLTSTDLNGRQAGYAYDAAARLTAETVTGDPRGDAANGTVAYSLDAVGNRLSRAAALGLAAQAFSYDANDQISGDTFDLNGNTVSSSGDTYAYDFRNRLKSKNSGAVTFVYDCDGNRVSKTAAGVTIKYLVDDLNPTAYVQVLEEVSGGSVQVRYTYGTSIVSQTRLSGSAGTSFYGFDGHGNVAFLTDTTGAVTDTYAYDAWGILVGSTGSTPNSRLYAGEEVDPDLGLVNLRARRYRPDTGRFLTIDPLMGRLANPITFDRYLYADGDPVNRFDPTGQATAAEYGTFMANLAVTYVNTFVLKGMNADGTKCAFFGGNFFGGLMSVITKKTLVGVVLNAFWNVYCRLIT